MASTHAFLACGARLRGPSVSIFRDGPVHPLRGEVARVWDAGGRKHPGCNTVPHAGQCHPHVAGATSGLNEAGAAARGTRFFATAEKTALACLDPLQGPSA